MVEGDNYPSGEVEGLHTMQCMAAAHHSHDNGPSPSILMMKLLTKQGLSLGIGLVMGG